MKNQAKTDTTQPTWHGHHRPTWPSTWNRNHDGTCQQMAPHASNRQLDFDDEQHKRNMQDLRREEPTTEDHAATQAPLDAIIVAKQKPAPRLSKPRSEDAAIDGEDAIILQSLSRARLQDDAPKEEKDAKTPPSPDPADLRFPVLDIVF